MRKRDARVERQLQKQLREEEKSARLRARPENVEAVRAASIPSNRSVRAGANPDSIMQMSMAWIVDRADREGDWSWGPRDWDENSWNLVISPKLQNYQSMLWHEIEAAVTQNGHRMHHSMEVDVLCNESRTRLGELLIFQDEIYRFRLGNLRRLWGHRYVNVFHILWYDPEHNIYPTDPD